MITTVILIAGIPAVIAVGAIVLLRAGIAREDSDHSLKGMPATRASAMTRRMVGLYVRTPQRSADDDDIEDRAGSPDSRRPCDRRRPR